MSRFPGMFFHVKVEPGGLRVPVDSRGSFATLDIDLDQGEAEGGDQGADDDADQPEGLNSSQNSEKEKQGMDLGPRTDEVGPEEVIHHADAQDPDDEKKEATQKIAP